VLSDLHLADVEDNKDGWMYYKSSRFLYDRDLYDLVDRFERSALNRKAEPVLVLNGDIFDFDLITAYPKNKEFKVSLFEKWRGLHANSKKSAWKLGRILDNHPIFCEALALFLSRGHKVVYVLGNHDREFHFDEVKQVFLKRLSVIATGLGLEKGKLEVEFRPWFYYVPGAIYVEHGQQYDHYTSFRYVLEPTVRIGREERLALPMGNLSNRYLMTKMGFFNPHASDFILNLYSYFTHWVKYYAFSIRGLAINWFLGSLVVMGKLLRIRNKLLSKPPDMKALMQRESATAGLEITVLQKLAALQRAPITSRFFRILREFWIDRLLLGGLMATGTVVLALVPIPLWIKLMVPLSAFPLAYFIYEWAIQGENIHTFEKNLPDIAGKIAKLLDVKVVAFGHTHRPRMVPLGRNTVFANTGTWAPVTFGPPPGRLKQGLRNFLHLRFEGAEPIVKLGSEMDLDGGT